MMTRSDMTETLDHTTTPGSGTAGESGVYENWLVLADGEVCGAGAEPTDALEGTGSPYAYPGPTVLPSDELPRGGSVLVSAVPNHARAWREDPAALAAEDPDAALAPFGVDFLRLWVCAPPAADADSGLVESVVVLDREQVSALRDTLDAWLSSQVRW